MSVNVQCPVACDRARDRARDRRGAVGADEALDDLAAALGGDASKPLVAVVLPPSPAIVTWQLRWWVWSEAATT